MRISWANSSSCSHRINYREKLTTIQSSPVYIIYPVPKVSCFPFEGGVELYKTLSIYLISYIIIYEAQQLCGGINDWLDLLMIVRYVDMDNIITQWI